MYNERWKGHFTLYRHGCRKAALKHQTPSNFLQFQMLNLSLTLLKDQNARRDWAQSSEFGDNQISGSWVLCWVNYHQLATTGCSTILEPIAFCSYLSQTFESLDVVSHLNFGWFKINSTLNSKAKLQYSETPCKYQVSLQVSIFSSCDIYTTSSKLMYVLWLQNIPIYSTLCAFYF